MSLLTSCNWCSYQRLLRYHAGHVVRTEPSDWPSMPHAVRVLVDGLPVSTYGELPEHCISLDGGECLGLEVGS